VTEPLASRGRRLHDTPIQRQQPTYAPDVIMRVEVVASHHKLVASYVEDEQLVLIQGENKLMRLWLTNTGSRPIGEVWMVAGAEDEIWIGAADSTVMQDCAYEGNTYYGGLYLMNLDNSDTNGGYPISKLTGTSKTLSTVNI
jgi:hypothetical protein